MLAAYPPVFAGLSMADSQEAAGFLKQVDVSPGEAIMIQGEQDTTLAFIVSGSCEIWYGETKIGTAGVHDMIGEVELFARIPRVASVTATNTVTLQILEEEGYVALCERGNPVVFSLERATLRRISDRLRQMNNAITSATQGLPFELHPRGEGLLARLTSRFRRAKTPVVDAAHVLSNSELFDWAPSHIVQDIAEFFQVQAFGPDTVICRQGEDGDTMYVLAAGSVEVVLLVGEDRAETVAVLQPGQAFGDASIAMRTARTATCVSREPSVVLSMDREKYIELHSVDNQVGSTFRQGMVRNLIMQLLATTERYAVVAGHAPAEEIYDATPLGGTWR